MPDNTIITIYRRQKLCEITSGAIATLPPIAMIAFGDGGVDQEGNPIPPVFDANSLNSEIGRYAIDNVEYPITPRTTARYTATIPESDLTSASISEAALIDADGYVCAIKTMYVKRKDNGVTFTFTFDDEF